MWNAIRNFNGLMWNNCRLFRWSIKTKKKKLKTKMKKKCNLKITQPEVKKKAFKLHNEFFDYLL